MKKTTYEVKPNEGKCFSEIDIKELVRVHEEVEEEEEDSDDGADAFDDSEVEEGDSEEYDTDDFSEEFTDEEDDWGMYFEVDNTNEVSKKLLVFQNLA